MKILAIETSCDETSASVVERKSGAQFVRVLSLVTSTSLPEHAMTGGIIPESAARRQIEYILPVVRQALTDGGCGEIGDIRKNIDAIAVTQGPGLIGSLLVGVECAKTLSYLSSTPLIVVNHLLAHLYANFVQDENAQNDEKKISFPTFPFIGLIVSGGHTDILLFKSHSDFKWLGGTRDDAIGEALDKIGRKLGLSYPAGPEIEKRAGKIKACSIKFNSPLLHSDDFDFSFSGLKTEVARYIDSSKNLTTPEIDEICYATQKAAFDVVVAKTFRAAEVYNTSSIVVGGGVAANQNLFELFCDEKQKKKLGVEIFFPKKKYTTDNAAMIGAFAAFNPGSVLWKEVRAMPELYFA